MSAAIADLKRLMGRVSGGGSSSDGGDAPAPAAEAPVPAPAPAASRPRKSGQVAPRSRLGGVSGRMKKQTEKKARRMRKDGKPVRWRPGTVAKREIREQRRRVDPTWAYAPFARLTRELLSKVNAELGSMYPGRRAEVLRMTPGCIAALSEAATAHLVEAIEQGNIARAVMGRGETFRPEHMRVALEFQGRAASAVNSGVYSSRC